MGEFFGGWKRKVGLLTLALACLFAAGWLRSLKDGDVFLMKMNDEYFTLRSTNSRLQFHHDWRKFTLQGEPVIGPTNGRIHDDITEWLDESPWRQTYGQFKERNSFYQLSPDSNIHKRKGAYPTQLWFSLPYWTLVLPLTLVSALLLLSKPRHRKSQSLSNSIPKAGGVALFFNPSKSMSRATGWPLRTTSALRT